MTSRATPDIKQLLLDAVERPESEREAYVARVAQDDPALARQLRALIDAWERATTVLQSPTEAALAAARVGDFTAERVGDRVGPYELAEVIGEGGFGLVYRARQEAPVKRDLAIKLLKPGMDSAAVLARFDAERQALARLTHPAIARIFDAGTTPSGRPFFAMELVEGSPITAHCDRRALPVRARLGVFVRVCEAVQHAHAKGIIHRDLKPSNLLIDEGTSEPKVIDFGIAKAIDDPLTDLSMITLAQQLVGTPRYMSPEQASLDPEAVDTRSDVYSLGVVLYELLCGSPPISDDAIRAKGIGALQETLREGRFKRPSERLTPDAAEARDEDPERLRRELAGELDWIVLRAIDPDPSRRYQTALALARDIERHLADEPVEARPPSRAYLARKFVRRHRAGVAAAGFITLALVAGLGAAVYGLRAAQRERDGARSALGEANTVTDFLVQAIGSVDPDELGREVRVADILDNATTQLASGKLDGSPASKARLHQVVGNARRSLGDWNAAIEQYRAALDIRRSINDPNDRELLTVMGNLSSCLYERGDLDEALRISSDLVDRATAALGPDDPQTNAALNNHALMLRETGDMEGALAIQKANFESDERHFGRDDERTVGSLHNYASTLLDMGRYNDAEAALKDALERAERGLDPDSTSAMLARQAYANLLFNLGRHDDADPLMRAAYADRVRVLGEGHPKTLLALYNLGANAMERGAWDDAAGIYADFLARSLNAFPPDHQIQLAALENIAGIYAHLGWASADEAFAGAVAHAVRAASEGSLTPAEMNTLATLSASLGPAGSRDLDAALALAARACAEGEAAADAHLFRYLDTLAMVHHERANHAGAVAAAERALALTPEDQPDARAEIEASLARYREALAAAGG